MWEIEALVEKQSLQFPVEKRSPVGIVSPETVPSQKLLIFPTASNPIEMSRPEPLPQQLQPIYGPPSQTPVIPPTPPCPPPKPHIGSESGNQAPPHSHNHPPPAPPLNRHSRPHAPHPSNSEWLSLFMSFCFAFAAMGMALNHHSRPHAPHPSNPEWLSLFMSFVFAAMGMAFQSIRPPNHLPVSFHMAGLGLVFALAAFVVSKYIPAGLRREAQLLENAGLFFGITAFFLDITISFPLCLKIISWVIYVTALLAIMFFYLRPNRVEG